MALYLEYSTRIYSIYLKYIAPEDIFPYSIDEVFMDVTDYLHTYNMTARELAMTMIQDVLKTTGITQLPELERICICVRLRWISWRSTLKQIKMVYELQNWMKCHTEGNSGATDLLLISGESERDMQRSWKNMASIRWVILPDVPSEKRMNYITKICYINCLALMQSC